MTRVKVSQAPYYLVHRLSAISQTEKACIISIKLNTHDKFWGVATKIIKQSVNLPTSNGEKMK